MAYNNLHKKHNRKYNKNGTNKRIKNSNLTILE